MIKINLTPITEMESQYWWVPDVAAFLIAFLLTGQLTSYLLETTKLETQTIITDTDEIRASINEINPQIERYKNIEREIATLNNKLNALKLITITKPERFRTIIVLEHLNNLKPEGLWYQKIAMDSPSPNKVTIEGASFDSLMVAEFMTSLKSSALTQVDPGDIRSQVVFDNIKLINTKFEKEDTNFKDLEEIYQFKLEVDIKIRSEFSAGPEGLVSFFDTKVIKSL